jgi:hypothetical protein
MGVGTGGLEESRSSRSSVRSMIGGRGLEDEDTGLGLCAGKLGMGRLVADATVVWGCT